MEKITKEINDDGLIYYINEMGQLHNINDEPAVIYKDGSKFWLKNGKAHRTKGPAVIYSSGNEFWFYENNHITSKVKQLIKEGYISSDWKNWTEEDEFLFILLVS